METRAINRYIQTSPRKMRLVIDLIRGKGVEEALSILHFTTKHAAKTAERVLRSAISNAQNKEESGRIDTSTLYIKEAYVNGGATAKRIMPAPMGRAFRIRKRSNHITIILGQRAQNIKAAAKPKAAADNKTATVKKAAVKKVAVNKKETTVVKKKETKTKEKTEN
ncbi:MAG: 50S ribosomal protein L22 [Bacteroidetes bacterium]|nr:50S ribosomal protein L22 [Bacteroidota bacterium]